MPYLKNIIYLALIISLNFCTGCSKPTAPSLQKTNVEQEFLDSFNKTSKLSYPLYVNTKIVGKSFWIYIALHKELLTINSQSGVGGAMPEKIIKFIDINCRYETSAFNLDYIFLKYTEEEKTKEKDLLKKTVGGTSLYQDFTDTTIEVLQKTYYAIGDIISKTEDMNFFVICLADIKNGIKITFVIHRLDMEQFLLEMLPSDEFYNRMILKTDGGKDIINDKYGLHIKYNDISLIDFLREQIINNAKATVNEMEKYRPKELSTIDKLDDILLKSTYEVTSKYEFEDYLLVEVENIISKEKLTLSKSQLLGKFSKPSRSYSLEYSDL